MWYFLLVQFFFLGGQTNDQESPLTPLLSEEVKENDPAGMYQFGSHMK